MATDTVATQTYTWRDARGHIGKTRFYISYDSGVAADAKTVGINIRTAVAALTNAALIKGTGPDGFELDPVTFGAVAEYLNAETKLRLVYLCGQAGPPVQSTQHRLEIPSPKVADFNTDQETALASAIAPLITVLKTAVGAAFVSNADSSPVQHGLGGVLIRRKLQRKLTIYDKLPDLSAFEL